jgi:polyphosphate kinase
MSGRSRGRCTAPLRRWKLSLDDEASIEKFAAFGAARNEMLERTNTPAAPCTVVNSNVRKRARLEAIRHVLHAVPYASKGESIVHAPDSRVVQAASSLFPHGD